MNEITALVEAPDGGQVEIKLVAVRSRSLCLLSSPHNLRRKGTTLETPFVEIIGNVLDSTTIKMMAAYPLSDNTNEILDSCSVVVSTEVFVVRLGQREPGCRAVARPTIRRHCILELHHPPPPKATLESR